MSIVVIVSAIDIYWSIKVGSQLRDTEENPVGKALIQMDGGDSALFMAVKFLGNVLVVLAVIFLYHRSKKTAVWVSAGLAIFQIVLVLYLYGVIPPCSSLTLGV